MAHLLQGIRARQILHTRFGVVSARTLHGLAHCACIRGSGLGPSYFRVSRFPFFLFWLQHAYSRLAGSFSGWVIIYFTLYDLRWCGLTHVDRKGAQGVTRRLRLFYYYAIFWKPRFDASACPESNVLILYLRLPKCAAGHSTTVYYTFGFGTEFACSIFNRIGKGCKAHVSIPPRRKGCYNCVSLLKMYCDRVLTSSSSSRPVPKGAFEKSSAAICNDVCGLFAEPMFKRDLEILQTAL